MGTGYGEPQLVETRKEPLHPQVILLLEVGRNLGIFLSIGHVIYA